MTVDSDIKAIIKQEFAKFHKEMKEELTKFNMEIMQALIESKFKDTEKEKGADGVGSIIDPSQESKPKKITKAEAKVTAKTEARVKAEARAIRFEALAKAEDSAAAEARIKASKAKASAFASFLKAERERHKSSPKVIKATIKDINVKSKGDSTHVNHQGVISRKMVVDSTELCSKWDGISVTNLVVLPNKELESKVILPVKDDCIKATNLVIKPSNLNVDSKMASSLQGDSTPATNLGDNPKVVEGEGDKPYFDMDCTPDTYTGVMPRKLEVDSIELCPENDSTPARDLGLIFKEVEGGVEPYSNETVFFLCSKTSDKERLINRQCLEKMFLKLESQFECNF